MIQTITVSDFRDAFKRCGRGNQFSYEALGLIFDYIEDYEQDSGEQVELDVIAICCEWSEDSPENIADQYGIEVDDPEDLEQEVIEHFEYHTQYAGKTSSGTLVYVQF